MAAPRRTVTQPIVDPSRLPPQFPLQMHFTSILFISIASAQKSLPIAWGFATSGLQIEGAYNADGKGLSVWDKWYLAPSRSSNPNHLVANDHYHKMKTDVAFLGQLGATAYRFSVSWTRIFPNCNGKVNEAGLQFYSDMIDEILKNGALPVLTMYHWDTPQACEDQYGSWLSPQIVADFTNYADVLFARFGDRVQYYLTMNEPSAECGWGYQTDSFWPPGANKGPSALYTCQHWTNLAHGTVVKLARTKYASKNFKFGMPLIVAGGIPFDPASAADQAAADRMMEFATQPNWGPLITGDYPDILKNDRSVGPNLLVYTSAQKEIMKGTLDFAALNYYSASYVQNAPGASPGEFATPGTKNGQPLGPVSGTSWQTVYGPGLRSALKFVAKTFPLDIMVTECGVSVPGEAQMTPQQVHDDTFRLNFWVSHLQALEDAILIDNVPVKAFLAWSLFDNFEWITYDQRFGLIAIDYKSPDLTRTVKNSTSYLSSYFSTSKSPYPLPKKGALSGPGSENNSAFATDLFGLLAVFGIVAISM